MDVGYEVEVYPKDKIMSHGELVKTLKKGSYDGVISLLTDKIDAAVFDAAPSVKVYANYASGFDNIDLVEAKNRGIAVANAPAPQTSESVAEHALALALALAARIVESDEFMRKGKYKGWDPMLFIGMDVLGKTLGIVGVGRIGGKVAHYAALLGLKVIYTDVSRNEQIEKESGAIFCNSIDELLSKADIVSLHVPLLDSTAASYKRSTIENNEADCFSGQYFARTCCRRDCLDQSAQGKGHCRRSSRCVRVRAENRARSGETSECHFDTTYRLGQFANAQRDV